MNTIAAEMCGGGCGYHGRQCIGADWCAYNKEAVSSRAFAGTTAGTALQHAFAARTCSMAADPIFH